MWKYENSILTDASPRIIWKLYRNILEWTKWDKGISKVTLNGAFEKGVTGLLTPIDQEPLPFTLSEVIGNQIGPMITRGIPNAMSNLVMIAGGKIL